MRLINAETYALEEFIPPVKVPYAILSHTWEQDEVAITDMVDFRAAEKKAGFRKIRFTCQQALKDGLLYAWVDTCCIDKASSAELSEAINSMFNWYLAATVCYVYINERLLPDGAVQPDLELFETSRWFTRGWTLQELLAPRKVQFFDASWTPVGTRDSLRSRISRATRISEEVLLGKASLRTCAVAQRMAWASNRTTTRVEDIAYCLLGIFDINMPILYGEGPKAFLRLQEEIIKNSPDLTLLAWKSLDDVAFRGVLARSPLEFQGCESIVVKRTILQVGSHITLTNKGLHVAGVCLAPSHDGAVFPLQFQREQTLANHSPLKTWETGILLRKTVDGYVRKHPSLLFDVMPYVARAWKVSTGANFFLVKDVAMRSISEETEASIVVRSTCLTPQSVELEMVHVSPQEKWDMDKSRFISTGLDPFIGNVVYQIQAQEGGVWDLRIFLVIFYCDSARPETNWARLMIDGDIPDPHMGLWQLVTTSKSALGEGMALCRTAKGPPWRRPQGERTLKLENSGRKVMVATSIMDATSANGPSTHVVNVSVDIEKSRKGNFF